MMRRFFNFALTLVVVAAAACAAWTLYQRYLQDPWTRDGQVRANVVGIAPRVAGPIIQVAVKDNQQVNKGDLLFAIDPADYQAKLDVARGQRLNAEATLKQREQEMARQTDLYERKVNTVQDYENAQNALTGAQAQVTSAKANEELAELDLGYTKIAAPVDGFVTNMNTSVGTYVSAGKELMALVDTGSYWIAAYFKETQLPRIRVGQKARVTILGHRQEPLEGVVRSIGWGIYVQDGSGGDTTGLLPAVNQTVDWVRLPQRFPVRIQLAANSTVPLRIGQTVSVAMQPITDENAPAAESVVRP
jgi:multidrug resistance efflux pump